MYTNKLKLFFILLLVQCGLNSNSQDTKIDFVRPTLSKYKIINSTNSIIINNATKNGWILVDKNNDKSSDVSIQKKFQAILSSEKENYEPCESIVIDATYINMSDKTIHFFDSTPYIDNQIFVYNDKEEELSLTKYGECVLGDIKKGIIDVFRNISMSLKPQKSIHLKILINRLFDMTQNGTYKIIIKRTFYDREKGSYCEVPSNSLKITISDQNAEHPTIYYSPKLSDEDDAWSGKSNKSISE